MSIQNCVLAVLVICAGASLFSAGPTEADKNLDREIRKALAAKDFPALPGLIKKLKDEAVSDQLRFFYCKTFVGSPRFSGPSLKASLDVLVHMYKKNEQKKHIRKSILQLVRSAVTGVKRNAKRFSVLLGFYRKIPDPAALTRIKQIFGRFQDDSEVVKSLCEALENQRVPESISILNSIYYSAWRKTDYTGVNPPRDHEKHLLFLSNISGKMKWALKSLTGKNVRSAEHFNNWWINNRRKFKVPPKPGDKKEKKKAAKEKKEKKEEKKESEEKKE